MIEIKKKIVIGGEWEKHQKIYAKNCRVGYTLTDTYGKRWEIGEDINFDKFWFREVKDKNAELVVKGFRKDD